MSPFFSELFWLSSRNEILYSSFPSSTPSAIKAVDVASHALRVVDGGKTGYRSLALSPDAQSVYYEASADGSRWSIYRVGVSGGSPELQVDSITPVDLPDKSFVLSLDGIHLAYLMGSDSVLLFDVVTKSRTFLTHGVPDAFSPDGLRLLVHRPACYPYPGACPFFAVTLASGASEPISFGLGAGQGLIRVLRWDSDGLRILFGDRSDFYVRNVTTSASARMIRSCETATSTTASWVLSPDGQHLAYWSRRNLAPLALSLASVQAEYVLAVTDDFGGTITFAPDGDRIAYIGGSTIFVDLLP